MLKYSLLSQLFLSVGLFTACSSNPPVPPASEVLASTDFENLDGWLPATPTPAALSREQAHSGKFSTMVGPNNEYSLGYSNALSRLAPDWPGRLTVGAWVLLTSSQSAPKFVVEIKQPTANTDGLLWEAVDVPDKVREYGKWRYIEHTITLPEAARPDNRLVVYLWRSEGSGSAFMDDVTIRLAK
ncbi:carbohydrate binding domain-containing protein [Hymenobacter aerophilus]|uniref:hypothetical protein n=1 Tax=Hymenobacter aerophilus TaxID=119644 RepID=UPI0003621896|nr:hypothetical protein [Hymenobacter aerophilus]